MASPTLPACLLHQDHHLCHHQHHITRTTNHPITTNAVANGSTAAIITAIVLSTRPSPAPSLPATTIMIDGSYSPPAAAPDSPPAAEWHRSQSHDHHHPVTRAPHTTPFSTAPTQCTSSSNYYSVPVNIDITQPSPSLIATSSASPTPAQTSSPYPQVRSAACITNTGTICTSQSSAAC